VVLANERDYSKLTFTAAVALPRAPALYGLIAG